MIELDRDQLKELRQLKLVEAQLLRQRERQIKEFGLKYYDPHPKQDAFHRAGKYKFRAVFAGNRFGKSDCGCAEDCAQALLYRPWIKEGDPARIIGIPQRPQKILVVTTDWGKVDEIFTGQRGSDLGKVWKFLPRGCVKSHKRNHSGAIELLELENGSLITFDVVEAFKKNPQGAESSQWDVIHVDEPCPEKMFNAHARGLMDRDGQAYFTLTPLTEPWIYDRFFGDEDARSVIERGQVGVFDDDFWSVTGSIWDNPYLSEDAIRRYLKTLTDEEERECREKGIPLQFAGLIYKEFEAAVHVMRTLPTLWDDYETPPANWPVYLQLDPHPQTPCAALLTTVGPSGRRYTFNELWKKGVAKVVVDEILKKAKGRNLVGPQCDPSAFIEDELTGGCWATDFGEHGIYFDKAPKTLDRGIGKVKEELLARSLLDGSPMWMFSPKLSRFLYEIKRWHWTKENRPVDKDDHTLECLYRTALMNPTFIDFAKSEPIVETTQDIYGLDDEDRMLVNDYTLN